MTISWFPVVAVDMAGSVLTLLIALLCFRASRQWTRKKPDDVFRQYIFLLTLAIVFFAISRSFGHLLKQFLLLTGAASTWNQLSPFSGAINTAAFVVIFAFGVYFHRFQKIHGELEEYKVGLERLVAERTAELVRTNSTLEEEIGERLKKEDELRESRNLLKNVLNSSAPLCITGLDFDILEANDAYYRLWPNRGEGSTPLKCYESRPGIDCHTDNCPLTRIVKGAMSVTMDSAKHLVAGREAHFLVTAQPFRNADGLLIGIAQNFQEITARKKAEEALAEEKERLAVTLRSIRDGVITTDLAGRIVLMNPVAEGLTGWSQQEAMGRLLPDVLRIVGAPDRAPRDNPVDRVLKKGFMDDAPGENLLLARDGAECFLEASGAPIRDRNSNAVGVVLVFRDVTERLRMAEEFQKSRKLESVGVLAGGIAHDFNNMLAAILGNISLATALLPSHAPVATLLKEAEKASLRARDLTQQLLTFSKGGEPIKETASIADVIRDSANFVLHGKNVACEYEIAEDLWLVDIDRGQISQVIQNLIMNAVQAMPGGGAVCIHCRNVAHGNLPGLPLSAENYVKITISDTGIGIAGSDIPKIFDPYFSTRREGSGLGLAVTHSIIAKHHGHIAVSSTEGVGTTFTILLPANRQGRLPPRAEESVPPRGQGKILVMDDEPAVRAVARNMLVHLGYETDGAKDGTEAIDLYQAAAQAGNPYDLLIMDLTIPGGLGGKEAARQILEIDPKARIIVSSGYSNDPVLANYREHGLAGVMIKPYRLQTLGASVHNILSPRR